MQNKSNVILTDLNQPCAPCAPACTKLVKFLTDFDVSPNAGTSPATRTNIDGFRHINIAVQFSQATATEPPVNLGVVFSFDPNAALGSRRYVNLETNVTGPQNTNFIEVSGQNSWHGNPHNISSYLARFPVMGPFVDIFVYNHAMVMRKVSVWGYLVS